MFSGLPSFSTFFSDFSREIFTLETSNHPKLRELPALVVVEEPLAGPAAQNAIGYRPASPSVLPLKHDPMREKHSLFCPSFFVFLTCLPRRLSSHESRRSIGLAGGGTSPQGARVVGRGGPQSKWLHRETQPPEWRQRQQWKRGPACQRTSSIGCGSTGLRSPVGRQKGSCAVSFWLGHRCCKCQTRELLQLPCAASQSGLVKIVCGNCCTSSSQIHKTLCGGSAHTGGRSRKR